MPITMKVKTHSRELPSTVICQRNREHERSYWTGSEWTYDLMKARQYLRADAEKRAAAKGMGKAFVITLGFPPNF